MLPIKLIGLFKKCVIFLFLLFPTTFLHGYFYNIQEWTNGRQSLFLFSDFHMDTDKETSQRIDLINAAMRMNAFVIAEDSLGAGVLKLDQDIWHKIQIDEKYVAEEYRDEGYGYMLLTSRIKDFYYAVYKNYYLGIFGGSGIRVNPQCDPNADYSSLIPSDYLEKVNNHITPLIALTQFCRQQRISTKNIEFRNYLIVEDVLVWHTKAVEELMSYDDGPVLGVFYKKILDDPINSEITRVLSDFVRQKPYAEFTSFVYKLIFDYNLLLIKARILHEIYCNKQFQTIFVCSGGAHIDDLVENLPALGFRLVPSLNIGVSMKEEEKTPQKHIINVKDYFIQREVPTKFCSSKISEGNWDLTFDD